MSRFNAEIDSKVRRGELQSPPPRQSVGRCAETGEIIASEIDCILDRLFAPWPFRPLRLVRRHARHKVARKACYISGSGVS